MNEIALKSALLVLTGIQQHLMAALAAEGLISLPALHSQLTNEIISRLQADRPDDPRPQPIETEVVIWLEQQFSQASVFEAAIRGARNDPAA